MRIVVLDAATLGADLDLSPLSKFGEVEVFATTAPHELAERLQNADVAVLNKIKINRETLPADCALRQICITATGFDNVDLALCRERGIAVCNVVGYSTESVAQATLAMALSLACRLPAYTACVADGSYTAGGVANRLTPVYHELCGKTWGVVGLGNIGRRVARVAAAMGCRVIAFKRTPDSEFDCVPLETLCREADVISIHLPLSAQTKGLIGAREIEMMKPDALLINVARGAVTDEAALAAAIADGRLGGLGVDVYSVEPMPQEHPFYPLRDHPLVCFTPHMAWGAKEARERCIAEVCRNIEAFQRGERRCRVEL